MSAMVDRGGGGGAGGRDVLKSYNPPPSYASVLTGRRAQSFFGGSTPSLPKRNSENSTKELCRNEKLLSDSVDTKPLPACSRAGPSTTSNSLLVSTCAPSATTATYYSSGSGNSISNPLNLEPVEKMEQSRACAQGMEPENQKFLKGRAISFEKVKIDRNEVESSRTNQEAISSLAASNIDLSRNVKISHRDEPNERRVWSTQQNSQRRSDDDGKRGQYMSGRNVNNKYRNDRNDTRTRYDNLEDKENQNSSEKRKSFLPDQDGWLTKVPIQKKAKNEKPLQQGQKVTRFGEVQRYTGPQRPIGPRPLQQGRGRDTRREYQGGRQTIVYSNSRGSTFGRRQSTRGIPPERNMSTSAPRRNDVISKSPPQTSFSVSLSSTSVIATSASTASVNAVPRKSVGFLPQPIIITSTTVCRPDLTPPPPPACGTFSYRDILAKGIQSPPPVQASITDGPTKSETEDKKFEMTPEMGSESSEIKTSCSLHNSSDLRDHSPTTETPSTSCSARLLIPLNADEKNSDQHMNQSSARQSFSMLTKVFTSASNENIGPSIGSDCSQIDSRCELLTETNRSYLISRSDTIQPDRPSSGPPPGLAICGSVETSIMPEVPPGFKNHILGTTCISSFNTSNTSVPLSDRSNIRFGLTDTYNISAMHTDPSQILAGHDINSELKVVQQDSIVHHTDHGTIDEKDHHYNFIGDASEMDDETLHKSHDSEIAGYLHPVPDLEEQDLLKSTDYCSSEKASIKSKEPSAKIAIQTSEFSAEEGICQELNESSLRLGEDFDTEHSKSFRQLYTRESSSSLARMSETHTFQLSEANSESTTDGGAKKNCEFTKHSVDHGHSPEEVYHLTNSFNSSLIDEELKNEIDGGKDLASETVEAVQHIDDSVVLDDGETGGESDFQPNEPLSAGELLQQIQSSHDIFCKKGVILNKVQENLSFPRKKKNTERAPAPPPTPNDDSYSGGWGSTPVGDADPEGSPFHLITSAAKELEHSISNNSMVSNDMSNIGPVELKGDKDRIERFNTNIEKANDSSMSEGVTIQTYNEKDTAADSCSDLNTDLKTGNDEEDFSSDKALDSCQDTTYNTVVDNDLNKKKSDECILHLSENVQNVQQAIGEDLKTMQRSVQPIVIKPMRKLEAFFPNSTQTWTAVSEDEPKIENTEALPRRVPKTKFRSNDHGTQSSVEAIEDVHGIQEVNVEQTPENVSNDLEKKYQIGEPATVQENQSPASSNRDWLKDDHSSMSPDIYSSMSADVSTSENLQVSSTSLAEKIAGFTSVIQSSIPSNTNDIWRTSQSKTNLTVTKSKLLTMERPETSPLETLMKHSSATSINLSVNFFKDTNTKISTVQTPIPLSSAQLHTTTVTTPKEQRSLVGSSSDPNYDSVPKVADVANQPYFIGTISSAGHQTVTSCSQEIYPLTHQGSNVLSGRSPNIPSSIPSLMQSSSLNPYPHQSPLPLPSQINIQAQEMDYQQLSRMSSGQHGNLTQPPHLNYVQPPAAPMQYPNMFDPRWSNNYTLDVNQSEWLNINRFPNSEREFSRPPQLHPLSQPVNLYNYPPPIPPQKESIFPNFNYPPPTFQPGYRLQTLPGFLQRPPPPLPPQYHSGYYNRAMDTRNSPSLRPPLHESPNSRDQSFGSVRNKLDGDRVRPPGHMQNQYQDIGNKLSPNEMYTKQFNGGSNMNSEQHSGRYDPNHGNKLLKPGASRQPHDPTLADFIPQNLDAYNKNQAMQETSFNSSWKQRNIYSDKRGYESVRKNFRPDHKEEVPYPPLPSSETYSESENQMGGSRRKNTFKGNLSATEPVKGSKPHIQETKQNTPMDHHKHEKLPVQMQYSNPNDMFLPGQAYPSLLPPLEFGPNPMSFGYPDNVNDPTIDKGGSSLTDYPSVGDKPECDDSRLGLANSPYDVQDFCSGGWKYYHETITSPSGLRIHQSTYVPYPNPCGSMTTAYLSTNDVRARIQWLGFKKAHELYTAKINAQRSLRMDVTVVCSKGGAVCCNSDILGTCSAYFHDRLFGHTDEYITIFVNVPSKIMKHFLQMMSCGEVFVPINDVNEVIMKAPIYLNLNM